MRLLRLHEDGSFSLTRDLVSNLPPYAILSHTWGEDEVSFQDIQRHAGQHKAGHRKLEFCGKQAAADGLQYFWVDTCCIDKPNHTELSEATNSMFHWYQNAAKCYVYLSDVYDHEDETAFKRSRWFTRGWTLLELIAPRSVAFFSAEAWPLGDKASRETLLHEITGIPVKALQGNPLSDFSVAERLSWQRNRQTTRPEDLAYSLLGIFNVYLPLIYGEGQQNAFIRLQQEIDKSSSAPPSLKPHKSSAPPGLKPLRASGFRILTLREGRQGDPIVCDRQEYSLHDPPEYVALSYVWGEEPPLHSITLDGSTHSIRPNLFYALRRQRDPNYPLLVWVDSLCINQVDKGERTAQVRLMSKIYQKATEVWIWLGEEDSTSKQAMLFFQKLIDSEFHWPDLWWEQYQFVAIIRLMDRQWFRRGWVTQEAAFAKVAIFFCGDCRLDLVTFRAVAAKIHSKIHQRMISGKPTDAISFQRFMATFQESPATKLFEILDKAFDRTAGQSEWRRNLSLESLVVASTYTSTTDQRDTVYSLLNMAKDVDTSPTLQMGVPESIAPDYGRNTLEVYADFILHCSQSGSIDIICLPWAPVPVDHPRPTWLRCRDFSPFGDPSQRSNLQHHARPLVSTAGRHQPYKCDNNAVPHISASYNPNDGTFDGSLRISGVILGEVIRASTRMANAIIIKECLEILGLHRPDLDSTLQDIPPEIWRTLCANRDKEGKPAPQSYASVFAHLLQGNSQSEPVSQWGGFSSIDIEDVISADPSDDIEYLEVVRDTVWNRRTCRLKSFRFPSESLVGLIPQHARAGDQVCILYGCSVPVVLREVPHEAGKPSWHLIGDAYVHGVMDGEALDWQLQEQVFRIC